MADSIEYKMVVLGSGAVGKSALTIRLVTQNFLKEYDPTIEDNYNKTITVDSIPAHLDILDTAGQDEYLQMQDQWMREGKGLCCLVALMLNCLTCNNYKFLFTHVIQQLLLLLLLPPLLLPLQGILVVYAIDNLTSFTDLEEYKKKIDRVKEREPYSL
jgi:GTPase SAR1 family protein